MEETKSMNTNTPTPDGVLGITTGTYTDPTIADPDSLKIINADNARTQEPQPQRKTEHRSFNLEGLEIRADGEGGARIVGHAAVFNKFSEDMFGMKERILPGAFTKTLREADIRALWNHNPDFPLGRMRGKDSDTLKLHEDNKGLAVDLKPPDTTYARDLMESIRRGDVDQMSFGFMVVREEWTFTSANKPDIRDLHEVSLFDVSPVTFPVYPQTDVAVKFNSQDMLRLAEVRSKLDSGKILTKEERIFLLNALSSTPSQARHLEEIDKPKDTASEDWRLSEADLEFELLVLQNISA